MSRSGYSDDCDSAEDQWALIRWRGAVNASLKGKRGQAFLRELAAAMDAMPDKRLTVSELESDGEFCTLGVIGQARGLNLSQIDTYDWSQLSREFGIAEALAREIMWENDEAVSDYKWVEVEICGPMRPHYPDWNRHTRGQMLPDPAAPERRWRYMRDWVQKQLKEKLE